MRVPNNSKFVYQKGQIELYFKFKAKNLSKNYIFSEPTLSYFYYELEALSKIFWG